MKEEKEIFAAREDELDERAIRREAWLLEKALKEKEQVTREIIID